MGKESLGSGFWLDVMFTTPPPAHTRARAHTHMSSCLNIIRHS